jgi:hypothetical protein
LEGIVKMVVAEMLVELLSYYAFNDLGYECKV